MDGLVLPSHPLLSCVWIRASGGKWAWFWHLCHPFLLKWSDLRRLLIRYILAFRQVSKIRGFLFFSRFHVSEFPVPLITPKLKYILYMYILSHLVKSTGLKVEKSTWCITQGQDNSTSRTFPGMLGRKNLRVQATKLTFPWQPLRPQVTQKHESKEGIPSGWVKAGKCGTSS